MPDRYHIHTVSTPGRFFRVGKFGGVDWREDCSRCSNCVKPRCCFNVYAHESAHNRDPLAAMQPLNECKACFSCVQGCTKGLLSLGVNPEFLEMGDAYWKPDMLFTTWNQAETGKIPVSGAGYRGSFHGFGFDSIWTDMSEIVRPTRDGIHGREYISTAVDVGPKPMHLSFSPDGKLLTRMPPRMELPIPAVLDLPAWPVANRQLAEARARAARELRTVAMVAAQDLPHISPDLLPHVAPVLGGDEARSGSFARQWLSSIGGLVELIDCPDVLDAADQVRAAHAQSILSVRMALTPGIAGRIADLARLGLKVFHLCADLHGCEHAAGGAAGRHIKDALREIHGHLVREGLRDQITLMVSGGIALAEHMAKAIICGADLVGVDTALLVALGCRVCRAARGADGESEPRACTQCPADIDAADSAYASQRMINLMGAWHSQLIEVLGAMGIREVRRLRGEMGRAIFMEEIEKEAFGDLLQVPDGMRPDECGHL